MLKRMVNECRFTLKIETKGPLLIKEGRLASDEESGEDWKSKFVKEKIISEGDKKDYPTAIFISLNTRNELVNAIKNKDYSQLKFYIPGTSLRGVMRSHAEKIVRTLWDNKQEPICCDPFGKIFCSGRLSSAKEKKLISGRDSYKFSCVICKLFGNTHSASRIRVHDSVAEIENLKLGIRDGIAIDRFTGGVSQEGGHGANFKNQFLEGTFKSEITIRNFELWQLGLLAYVLRDFEQELITIGFGKNKGFGRVKGTIDKVQLSYFCDNQNKLKGIGEICSDEKEIYDFVSILPNPPALSGKPICKDLYRKKQFEIEMPKNNGGIVESNFWKDCAKIWNCAVSEGKFKTVPMFKEEVKKRGSESKSESRGANDG